MHTLVRVRRLCKPNLNWHKKATSGLFSKGRSLETI